MDGVVHPERERQRGVAGARYVGGANSDTINNPCGYVNTKITKDALTADFRVLDYVTTPGSPVSTKASFAIQDGYPASSVAEPAETSGG
nr:hypothetical protein [Pseudarthrobacter sp. NIBRBAC000502772]